MSASANAIADRRSQSDLINFSKNLVMLGAAVVLMGVEEPWPISVPVAQPSVTERARRVARRIAA